MESHIEQAATCREALGPDAKCRAVEASRVGCRKLNWIWPGRVPLGKVSLLVGESGRGKSLVACELAARVTSGKDAGLAGSVMMLSSDDPRDTLSPRLLAAGADLEKVVLVGSGGGERLVFDQNLDEIREILKVVPDCRMIVVDSWSVFAGDSVRRKPEELRQFLYELTRLARERQVAVVLVTGRGGSGREKQVFAELLAASASAWLVEVDPQDAERRVLVAIKNNLAAPAAGLAFRIESAGDAAKIAWLDEPVELTADDFASARSNLAERKYRNGESFAMGFLRQELADGPQLRRDIWHQAEQAELGKDQLYRAANRLGIVMQKSSMSWEGSQWMLPTDAENCEKSQADPTVEQMPASEPMIESASASQMPAQAQVEVAETFPEGLPPADDDLEYAIFCRQSVRPFIPSAEPLSPPACVAESHDRKRPQRQLDQSMKRRAQAQRKRERELAERVGVYDGKH